MRDGTDNSCRPDWCTIVPDRDDDAACAKALQRLPGVEASRAKFAASRRHDIAQRKFFLEQQVAIGWSEIAALDDDAIANQPPDSCHQLD